MARARIILVDDHPLILAGLKILLQDDVTLEVVGQASDGQSALRLAARTRSRRDGARPVPAGD